MSHLSPLPIGVVLVCGQGSLTHSASIDSRVRDAAGCFLRPAAFCFSAGKGRQTPLLGERWLPAQEVPWQKQDDNQRRGMRMYQLVLRLIAWLWPVQVRLDRYVGHAK